MSSPREQVSGYQGSVPSGLPRRTEYPEICHPDNGGVQDLGSASQNPMPRGANKRYGGLDVNSSNRYYEELTRNSNHLTDTIMTQSRIDKENADIQRRAQESLDQGRLSTQGPTSRRSRKPIGNGKKPKSAATRSTVPKRPRAMAPQSTLVPSRTDEITGLMGRAATSRTTTTVPEYAYKQRNARYGPLSTQPFGYTGQPAPNNATEEMAQSVSWGPYQSNQLAAPVSGDGYQTGPDSRPR